MTKNFAQSGTAACPVSWSRIQELPFILLFFISAAAKAPDMMIHFFQYGFSHYIDTHITENP